MTFKHPTAVSGFVHKGDEGYPIVNGIVDCPEAFGRAEGWATHRPALQTTDLPEAEATPPSDEDGPAPGDDAADMPEPAHGPKAKHKAHKRAKG